MQARRDVFQAIADPVRREIIHQVSQKSMNLKELAENFAISRTATTKHVQILNECGLLNIRKQGRERWCEANLQALGEVALWVHQYRRFWNSRLDKLEDLLTNDDLSKEP